MHALLYRSNARPDLLAGDLNDIVASSERHNPLFEITGLLLYAELAVMPGALGGFVQWIEGPEVAVDALFALIEDDRRHSGVEVLARGPSVSLTIQDGASVANDQGRLFPIWSMGLVRLNRLPATLNGFLEFTLHWDGRTNRREA